MVDGLCQRYSCLPSALMDEDASYILPMLEALSLAGDLDSRSDAVNGGQ